MRAYYNRYVASDSDEKLLLISYIVTFFYFTLNFLYSTLNIIYVYQKLTTIYKHRYMYSLFSVLLRYSSVFAVVARMSELLTCANDSLFYKSWLLVKYFVIRRGLLKTIEVKKLLCQSSFVCVSPVICHSLRLKIPCRILIRLLPACSSAVTICYLHASSYFLVYIKKYSDR